MAGKKPQYVLLAKDCAASQHSPLLSLGESVEGQGTPKMCPNPPKSKLLSSPLRIDEEGGKPCAGTWSFQEHRPLLQSHSRVFGPTKRGEAAPGNSCVLWG